MDGSFIAEWVPLVGSHVVGKRSGRPCPLGGIVSLSCLGVPKGAESRLSRVRRFRNRMEGLVMDNEFKSLVSLVNEYLEGYTKVSLDEIRNRIQDSYESDDIDGHQYDYLIGLILE